MSNFFSGIVQKANDQIDNVTSGNTPDTSGATGDSSGDHPDYKKGLHESEAAFKDFNKAQHAMDGHGKPDKKKSVKNFFKSAFGFGKAAEEAMKAGEDFTGKTLKSGGES